MTLEEYSKLAPGTRVYLTPPGSAGKKFLGVAGKTIEKDPVPLIRFDNNMGTGVVSEKNINFIHLEPLN